MAIFNKYRNSSGSIIVEAALIIPILLGITFFIIEFGNILYISNSLNQIARSVARIASVTSSYTNQQLITESGATSLLKDISKFSLTISPASGMSRAVGAQISVTAQYNYTPIINPFKLLNSNQSWSPVLRSIAISRSEVSNVSQ